jgi:hypothetical protein
LITPSATSRYTPDQMRKAVVTRAAAPRLVAGRRAVYRDDDGRCHFLARAIKARIAHQFAENGSSSRSSNRRRRARLAPRAMIRKLIAIR